MSHIITAQRLGFIHHKNQLSIELVNIKFDELNHPKHFKTRLTIFIIPVINMHLYYILHTFIVHVQ